MVETLGTSFLPYLPKGVAAIAFRTLGFLFDFSSFS